MMWLWKEPFYQRTATVLFIIMFLSCWLEVDLNVISSCSGCVIFPARLPITIQMAMFIITLLYIVIDSVLFELYWWLQNQVWNNKSGIRSFSNCCHVICDTIKGNESLVENCNFYYLTPLSQNFKLLHFDANPHTIGYLVTEL